MDGLHVFEALIKVATVSEVVEEANQKYSQSDADMLLNRLDAFGKAEKASGVWKHFRRDMYIKTKRMDFT